ncbi:MAG: short-chain dehydrogenase/reductase [Ignavibacteria bacterium]|nr:short-chain dehydrogenase/reductase [Ignavibacteria bacterium]
MPVILITGSGRRLGRSLALDFARSDWDVGVHYNNSEREAIDTVKEIKKTGRRSYAVKADLTHSDEVRILFEEVINNLGIPSVLINNAGFYPLRKSIDETTDDDWENTFNINLDAVFRCCRQFAKFAEENSRIINISSIGGLKYLKNRIPYSVSKAATIDLTKALAIELAPGISVNCICPGALFLDETDLDSSKTMISPKKIPMLRYGTSSDVFDAAMFFASSSNYITGQILSVDGGLSII